MATEANPLLTPRLLDARYVAGYRIHLRFADGVAGEIDLRAELWGEVFEPLKDVEHFRRFTLWREANTICWDTGADLAPEFLYEQTRLAMDVGTASHTR